MAKKLWLVNHVNHWQATDKKHSNQIENIVRHALPKAIGSLEIYYPERII